MPSILSEKDTHWVSATVTVQGNFGHRQLAIKSERIPQKVQPAVLVASLEVYIQEDLFH